MNRVVLNSWFWDSPMTGSGQYTRRLVENLAVIAPDVQFVLAGPWSSSPQPETDASNVALVALTANVRRAGNLGKVWFEQVVFPRLCRRLGADVAHVPYWGSPLFSSVPTLVTIHDLIPRLLPEYRGGALVRLYTALVSRSAHSARLVLTDSQASSEDISTHLRLPDVRAIPLAADARYTAVPGPADASVRARYGLPDRYVLYLGGFDVRKNLRTTIAVYRLASHALGSNCPLVIAGRMPEGDTPFTPDPRRMAREEGLPAEKIRFPGPPEDIHKPALYRGALAFIFPSRYEGFGLPPLEALACGTPVIGSATSAVPEVVGDAGLLFAPDDVEGMAQALVRLAIEDDLRAELGRRAISRASRFSWRRTAERTLAAYHAALN